MGWMLVGGEDVCGDRLEYKIMYGVIVIVIEGKGKGMDVWLVDWGGGYEKLVTPYELNLNIDLRVNRDIVSLANEILLFIYNLILTF